MWTPLRMTTRTMNDIDMVFRFIVSFQREFPTEFRRLNELVGTHKQTMHLDDLSRMIKQQTLMCNHTSVDRIIVNIYRTRDYNAMIRSLSTFMTLDCINEILRECMSDVILAFKVLLVSGILERETMEAFIDPHVRDLVLRDIHTIRARGITFIHSDYLSLRDLRLV